MADLIEEKVVMTPKCKTATSTTLVVERKAVQPLSDSDKVHVAGGDHTGIIINKEQIYENGVSEPCHAQLEFRVYLVNAATGGHTREARGLQFWFKPQLIASERSHRAQMFFRDLVSPHDFPKDYVGYIKKIMKMMQNEYKDLKTLEIEIRQEGNASLPAAAMEEIREPHQQPISEQRVLEMIENAYPNPMAVNELLSASNWSQDDVTGCLTALEERGLARAMSDGIYIRQHSIDTQVVGQMPKLSSSSQPTIAVITALYCEKQAVDSMMDNQETYVRYTTVGESNVYTLGTIGDHRVVTTKLPSVGRTREAMTAAGNTTTRLLGIFQKVEYVFLVGVGGGVPHYTDYSRHVRLGDVVISTPAPDLDDKYVYIYCERAKRNESGGWDYEVKPYRPASYYLQELALKQIEQHTVKHARAPWNQYVKEGQFHLESMSPSQHWSAPSSGDNSFCVDLGHGNIIEMTHPTPKDSDQRDSDASSYVRVVPGCVGGGRCVSVSEPARAHFAAQARLAAYDCELDAVLDSVLGNRKDCFISIRGICDYRDGTRGKEWQPYASLAAAAVMKAIITAMKPMENSEEY